MLHSTLSKAKIAINDPRRVLSKLYEVYDTSICRNEQVNVLHRDWDTLIILDACRFDLFESINTLDGDLSKVRSVGSKTGEFLHKTFGTGEYPEIVYTSANPNLSVLDATFHERYRIWETDWNEELSVVPPKSTTDAALSAIERNPEKRHIIHYMQPHIPFIGESGRELLNRDNVEDLGHGVKFWEQMKQNPSVQQQFRDAYRENLEITLPEVQRLAANIDGRTVVTSDHGNELGWFGVYGHPGGFYTPGLINVPWLDMPYDRRRRIEPGSATAGPETDAEVVEKLGDLGYIN